MPALHVDTVAYFIRSELLPKPQVWRKGLIEKMGHLGWVRGMCRTVFRLNLTSQKKRAPSINRGASFMLDHQNYDELVNLELILWIARIEVVVGEAVVDLHFHIGIHFEQFRFIAFFVRPIVGLVADR